VEIDDRRTAISAVVAAVDAAAGRWARQRLVVPDTSVFYNAPARLDEWDIRAAVPGLTDDDQLRLVVPMVVVDELDRLKENNAAHVRWRAGQTLRVLHQTLGATTDGTMAAQPLITLEVLVDPPTHRRLPLEDDEVLERALLVQMIAKSQVAVMGSDYGQLWRAAALDLDVIRLDSRHASEFRPEAPEPRPPRT
jgi:hypothetical protein